MKQHFSRFLESARDRLHFAAHSHHPWPDVTFDAHQRAWQDAAELADDKWDRVFGVVMPETRLGIARTLGLSDPDAIAFSPNTHSLLLRLFSCLDPPVTILSTDAEFHSFERQSRRWEEAGLAVVNRVPVDPYSDFARRFTDAARDPAYDLIYFSHVHFDSGYVMPDLHRFVATVPDNRTFVVVDGYHSYMALPTDLGSIEGRAFFLAGGYKYAMAGEGVCFMHCPPTYGTRPVDTGWYAGFSQLESGMTTDAPYGSDGSRFLGSTFDPVGVYRMRAVLSWLEGIGMTPADIHDHVRGLQDQFLEATGDDFGELLPDASFDERGHFLTYKVADPDALYRRLHDRGVITDFRRDRIRFGFGIYQDAADVEELTTRLR